MLRAAHPLISCCYMPCGRRLDALSYKIMSVISAACNFTTKSDGVCTFSVVKSRVMHTLGASTLPPCCATLIAKRPVTTKIVQAVKKIALACMLPYALVLDLRGVFTHAPARLHT